MDPERIKKAFEEFMAKYMSENGYNSSDEPNHENNYIPLDRKADNDSVVPSTSNCPSPDKNTKQHDSKNKEIPNIKWNKDEIHSESGDSYNWKDLSSEWEDFPVNEDRHTLPKNDNRLSLCGICTKFIHPNVIIETKNNRYKLVRIKKPCTYGYKGYSHYSSPDSYRSRSPRRYPHTLNSRRSRSPDDYMRKLRKERFADYKKN
jgi:hypothetical protein